MISIMIIIIIYTLEQDNLLTGLTSLNCNFITD